MGAIRNMWGKPLSLVLLEDDVDRIRELQLTVNQAPDDLTLITYTSRESEVARMAKENLVDCVFVDESLPRRPWVEVVRELRETYPATRVILHTERPSPQLLDEALDKGARSVIKKGLSIDELVVQLKDVLDDERRRKQRFDGQFQDAEEARRRFELAPSTVVAMPQGHIIAVGSGIAGGTGKTSAILNMAIWLSKNPYRSLPGGSVVCDFEKDVGSVSSFFEDTQPAPSIREFKEYQNRPAIPPNVLDARMCQDAQPWRKYGLKLMFGACDLECEDEVTEELVRTVLVSLRQSNPFVFVDLPADLTDAAVASIEQATRVLWLVRDYMPDLTRASRAFQKLKQLGVDTSRIQVVLSRVDPKGSLQFTPRQIHDLLNCGLMSYAIPEEPQMKVWARAGQFPAVVAANGPYMRSLRNILEEIQPGTGFPLPTPAAKRLALQSFWPFPKRRWA